MNTKYFVLHHENRMSHETIIFNEKTPTCECQEHIHARPSLLDRPGAHSDDVLNLDVVTAPTLVHGAPVRVPHVLDLELCVHAAADVVVALEVVGLRRWWKLETDGLVHDVEVGPVEGR